MSDSHPSSEAASPAGASTPEPTAEERFDAEVRANLARNYGAYLAHGLLGQTGFRLIQAPTFIPAYVYLLSGSDVAVGLARGFQALGSLLTPILSATLIEHRRRVLPVNLAVGAAMRVQVLGIALAGFFLRPDLSLLATWLFLGLFGLLMGMQGVAFNFLMAKVIPVKRRGILMGLRNALAGVTTAGVGVVGGYLVEGNALGNGYASTFLVAFCLTALGLSLLLFMREPESPQVREAVRLPERLRQLPALLRSDRAFTRYFLARAVATMGRMGFPFYVLYAATKMEVSGSDLGILTGVFALASSVINLLWGAIADRRGFRIVFLSSISLWIGATLLLMLSTGFAGLAGVFLGLGAGFGGFQMSAQNLVLEFGSRRNLPMRIAVANSAAELVGAVGPVLGGLIAMLFSYMAVFWTAVAFQLLAVCIVWLWVEEPRRRRR